MFDWKRRRRERIAGRPIPETWAEVLDGIPWIGHLPEADRTELGRHIQVLLAEKRFEGAGGFVMSDAARLTIAAQAAVLLLHRPTDYFPGLHSIIVYPAEYEAPVEESDDGGIVYEGDESRAGETWLQGSLVLSWDDIVADSADSETGLSVVLHEFAHQLDAETGEMNGLPRIADRMLRTDWSRIMSESYERHVAAVEAGRATVLDPYGAEDPAEFFAVVVEAFFLQPLQLRSAFADAYRLLSSYFVQDPAEWRSSRCEARRSN
jgi:Mlc titration factor MtfA (ptsG expression regulator)